MKPNIIAMSVELQRLPESQIFFIFFIILCISR